MACNKCTMVDEPQILERCVKCILQKKYSVEIEESKSVTCYICKKDVSFGVPLSLINYNTRKKKDKSFCKSNKTISVSLHMSEHKMTMTKTKPLDCLFAHCKCYYLNKEFLDRIFSDSEQVKLSMDQQDELDMDMYVQTFIHKKSFIKCEYCDEFQGCK